MKYLSSRNYFFSPVLFFQDKQIWRNLWRVSLMLLECKYALKYLDRGPKNRIMPRKNDKSQGKVREFEKCPKNAIGKKVLKIIISIYCK